MNRKNYRTSDSRQFIAWSFTDSLNGKNGQQKQNADSYFESDSG
jgi:hypothetical protein